jgi:ADP-ribose pyrophosphatase YjhB (NUDIX family)
LRSGTLSGDYACNLICAVIRLLKRFISPDHHCGFLFHMKFCSECAHPVALRIPDGDTRIRCVCDNCGTIHYENPKLVVGTVPVWTTENEVRVLLCKRAIEPRYGYWTLPAGFMENGESTGEAAVRETQEEAGANIVLHELFSLVNVPHVDQVHLFYLATLQDINYQAGIESLEVALFTETEIPWEDIAFPTVAYTLRAFFKDIALQREGRTGFGLHHQDIRKPVF